MVRGRKPVPTALKLVKGERPDRMNTDEPMPEEGIPKCPVKTPAVVDVWNYTVQQLTAMRVLTMADRDLLLAYCQAVVMHREASRLLAQDGYILGHAVYEFDGQEIADRPKLVTHPAVKLQREAAATIKAFGTEFGLTPAARTRIRVGDQKASEQQEQGAGRLLSG